MNKVYIEESLNHTGVRGMKWGVRRANAKTAGLSRTVQKTVKRFDRGKDLPEGHIQNLSKKVRSSKSRIDNKVKNAQRFLAKGKKADAKQIINRYNNDPIKKAAVENYIESLKLNSTTLAELRLQLIDIRI